MSNLEEIKQDLVSEIQERVEDRIMEQSNADLLIKLINNSESVSEAISIAELGTSYQRTGFHFDVKMEKFGNAIKYLKKNDVLSFAQGGTKNSLIVGDNYDALQNLLISHKEKVDVIYIDPPYGKDSMGVFADTNYTNSITRDNLLSMLYPRIKLAKKLLSESGVLFCSIDDRNQAYIKCLFDDVFREENFIACVPKKGTGGRQDSSHYAVIHEYVLIYAKNANEFVAGKQLNENKVYPYKDKNGKEYNTQLLRKWGDSSKREDRPNLYYPIYFDEVNNKLNIERQSETDIEIFPMISATQEGRWRWGKDNMQINMDKGLIEMRSLKNQYVPYERIYKEFSDNTKVFSTWIDDVDISTGASLIKSLDLNFSYPKATDLIKKILLMAGTKKDGIILDFYAGSGTTGQAVLELNKEDGGNRQFILCTNNEITEMNPHGIAYDVTAERLKRIMTGKTYDGTSEFSWAKDNEPLGNSLDVYDIATVANFESVDKKTPFDVIDETNYELPRFENIQDKIEWVCDNFDNAQKLVEGE